jgi:hypothetical protein
MQSLRPNYGVAPKLWSRAQIMETMKVGIQAGRRARAGVRGQACAGRQALIAYVVLLSTEC